MPWCSSPSATAPARTVTSQAVCRRIGMTPIGLSDRYYDETVEVFEALA